LQPATARATYTGGYTTPDSPPGQFPLPADLEHAAIEQVACWFQTRDLLGIRTSWPSGGAYHLFADQDLLQSVSATLARYRRYQL
jgi:hypothetical protein